MLLQWTQRATKLLPRVDRKELLGLHLRLEEWEMWCKTKGTLLNWSTAFQRRFYTFQVHFDRKRANFDRKTRGAEKWRNKHPWYKSIRCTPAQWRTSSSGTCISGVNRSFIHWANERSQFAIAGINWQLLLLLLLPPSICLLHSLVPN